MEESSLADMGRLLNKVERECFVVLLGSIEVCDYGTLKNRACSGSRPTIYVRYVCVGRFALGYSLKEAGKAKGVSPRTAHCLYLNEHDPHSNAALPLLLSSKCAAVVQRATELDAARPAGASPASTKVVDELVFRG